MRFFATVFLFSIFVTSSGFAQVTGYPESEYDCTIRNDPAHQGFLEGVRAIESKAGPHVGRVFFRVQSRPSEYCIKVKDPLLLEAIKGLKKLPKHPQWAYYHPNSIQSGPIGVFNGPSNQSIINLTNFKDGRLVDSQCDPQIHSARQTVYAYSYRISLDSSAPNSITYYTIAKNLNSGQDELCTHGYTDEFAPLTETLLFKKRLFEAQQFGRNPVLTFSTTGIF